MKTKTTPRYYPIITDESGEATFFNMPHGGIFYDTHLTDYRSDLRIEKTKDKLCDMAYARQDQDERMLFDEDDKVELCNTLKRTGRWIV